MTYTNPLTYVDGLSRTNPDPFVARFAGLYWCYSTDESGVNLSCSPDLVAWSHKGYAFQDPDGRNYWAPCVVYADGRFWMYVSWAPKTSDDPHDEHLRCLVSDRPEGPFTVVRKMFSTFSIDADVTRDPQTGDWLLFYSTNDATGLDNQGTGTSILVDRLIDMAHPEGNARVAVVPTLEQEIFQKDRFGDGRDWYTIEGATYFRRGDLSLLTYSGNAYTGTDYFIGYARSRREGPIFDQRWEKYPNAHTWGPLVRRGNGVEGTGHNSIVRAPNLVDDWIVYHGRNEAIPLNPAQEQRMMRIDPLRLDGERLQTPAPTSTPQEAPARPTVFDALSRASDRWSLPEDILFTSDDGWISNFLRTTRANRTEVRLNHVTDAYVAEVWFRMHRSDAGARSGLLVCGQGPSDHLDLLIDAATRTVSLVRIENGFSRTIAKEKLGNDLTDAWYRLQVTRTFGSVDVYLNGRLVLSAESDWTDRGYVGLLSVGTKTDFSSFGLTDHVALRGQRLTRWLPKLFRSGQAFVTIDDGLVASRGQPVALQLQVARAGWAYDFDLDLLSEQGTARIEIVEADGAAAAVLTLGKGSADLVIRDQSNSRASFTTPLADLQTTARLVLKSEEIQVEVSSERWNVPASGRGLHVHSLVFHNANLRGIELTDRPQTDHSLRGE